MASNINTTEYMYCSARIRAMEVSMITRDKMRAVADSSTFSEAINKILEYGVEPVYAEDGEIDAEAMLQRIYTDACEFVGRYVPHPEQLDFLRYPYDCNNLKAAIKCYFRGISPDSMLYDCGACSAESAVAAVKGEPTEYPENMSAAVSEAMESYSKTKNPQNIDVIMDRACFSDMLARAEASGCEFFVKLVRAKIDLTNIITCLRLIRMNMGQAGYSLLGSAILDGGTYDAKFFCECYDGGEDKLCEALAFSDYYKFINCICENRDGFSQIEKFSDDMYVEIAREAKSVPFGPEVAAGYLIGVEYQIKNLRIILDAKLTGRSTEATNERLRCAYV